MNNIKDIIKSANSQKPDKYNILTFPTHERYETQLCKTGHNFYSCHIQNNKKWNKEQTAVPENYYILPENQVINYIDFDFILVQSKYWQYQVAMDIIKSRPLPIIVLEHTLPTPETVSQENIQAMKQMVGHINVFISEFSKSEWGIENNSKVIYHGVDSETFKPIEVDKEDYILTVANDFKNRNYCLNYEGWNRITEDLETVLVGENNGEGSKACKNADELAVEYNKCKVYLNTTTLSPIPMSLLEAMSCGCAVVSTATCMIPEVIQDGVNGFISNDEKKLREKTEMLLANEELRKTMGENARKTIQNMFSEQRFLDEWNNTFDQICEAKKI